MWSLGYEGGNTWQLRKSGYRFLRKRSMRQRFAEQDSRFADLDGRFSALDSKVSALESRFVELQTTQAEQTALLQQILARLSV
jgi:hypothetical protein